MENGVTVLASLQTDIRFLREIGCLFTVSSTNAQGISRLRVVRYVLPHYVRGIQALHCFHIPRRYVTQFGIEVDAQ